MSDLIIEQQEQGTEELKWKDQEEFVALTIEQQIEESRKECFEATGRDYEILDEELYDSTDEL